MKCAVCGAVRQQIQRLQSLLHPRIAGRAGQRSSLLLAMPPPIIISSICSRPSQALISPPVLAVDRRPALGTNVGPLANPVAQPNLRPRLMPLRIELKPACQVRLVHRPARQDRRQVGHVRLRVAAVHPHRVQLHNLAAIVLVQSLVARLRSRIRRIHAIRQRIRPDAQPVVQIHHHRRALRRRQQQVAELAQRILADRIALVAGRVPLVGILGDVDVEVIEPEVRHHLLQLPLAHNRAHHLRLRQLLSNLILRADARRHAQKYLALARREVRQQQILLVAGHIAGKRDAVLHRHRDQRRHPLVLRQRKQLARNARRSNLALLLLRGLLRVARLSQRIVRSHRPCAHRPPCAASQPAPHTSPPATGRQASAACHRPLAESCRDPEKQPAPAPASYSEWESPPAA